MSGEDYKQGLRMITCLILQGCFPCHALQLLLQALHVNLCSEKAMHAASVPHCPCVPVYLLLLLISVPEFLHPVHALKLEEDGSIARALSSRLRLMCKTSSCIRCLTELAGGSGIYPADMAPASMSWSATSSAAVPATFKNVIF